MRLLLLIVVAFVFCAFSAGTAQASDRYAGLTRLQAIHTAKDGVIGLALAFGKLTPTQAAKLRIELDKREPRTTRSHCNGKPAWRVKWPDSDPLFVNRSGLVLAC